MRAAGLIALLALCACAPQKPAPAPAIVLDCKLGFEALSKEILADPSLTPALQEPGEPYRFYRPQGGGPTFAITQAGAPGHPAIFKQEAVRIEGKKAMMTTGCPFGDPKGYSQVMAYLQGLSAASAPSP